ncbi:unnamed protein product [Fusarium fujikuroi]|uniref:Uncharacterized protein n=1 Tax=Fusarium fujikuroi TaxID=5127 RepID=A0A9Q9S202_FUSFU|nr:unnamed protein product [Fusarium fujikuroi]VTT84148.1 unnamed protein product [Fusarium fujikuroi]VZI07328.1 unnamed protein product [Fusarium fujikuroi]
MDSSMSPFSTNGNDSSAKYIANKASSHNEAVIIAGVMIGSVFFVAIVGVAWMFFRERSRKIKDQLAAIKTVSASEISPGLSELYMTHAGQQQFIQAKARRFEALEVICFFASVHQPHITPAQPPKPPISSGIRSAQLHQNASHLKLSATSNVSGTSSVLLMPRSGLIRLKRCQQHVVSTRRGSRFRMQYRGPVALYDQFISEMRRWTLVDQDGYG